MKRERIAVLLLMCVTALAVAYCVSRPSAPTVQDAGASLYDAAGVRVGMGLHAKAISVRRAETSVVQGSDESWDVTIDDGRGAPMIVAFQATCCNGVAVQAVTDRIVALRVMPGVGIGTSEFYVADRTTREIRHYLLEGSYLATTADGGKIVQRDGKGIVVVDASLGELQRTAWAPKDEYVNTALASPDDRYVGFLTWNGGHDEDEKWHAYAYDLEKNAVIDLGSAAYADGIRWNGTAFVGLIQQTGGGTPAESGSYAIP